MAYAPWEGALTRTRSVSDPQGSKRQRCQRNPHPPVTRGEGLLWGANSQIENIVVTIKHTERTLSMSFLAGPSAWTTCTNHAPSSNEHPCSTRRPVHGTARRICADFHRITFRPSLGPRQSCGHSMIRDRCVLEELWVDPSYIRGTP